MALVSLEVGSTKLMMTIGVVAFAAILNAWIGERTLDWRCYWHRGHNSAFLLSFFILLIEIESVLEWLALGLPHPLTVVTVFVVLGGVATVWLTWRASEPSESEAV